MTGKKISSDQRAGTSKTIRETHAGCGGGKAGGCGCGGSGHHKKGRAGQPVDDAGRINLGLRAAQ